MQAGLAAARPGATCHEVDAAARGAIEDAGFGEYFVHRTGHGLGISTHEPPWIMRGENVELKVGMVHSIEPGIYLPGEFGVRLEEIVHVTDEGCERFSASSARPSRGRGSMTGQDLRRGKRRSPMRIGKRTLRRLWPVGGRRRSRVAAAVAATAFAGGTGKTTAAKQNVDTKTLIVAVPSDIQNLDPTLSSADVSTQEMLTNVYDWLVDYKVVNRGGGPIGAPNQFVGAIAKSYTWNATTPWSRSTCVRASSSRTATRSTPPRSSSPTTASSSQSRRHGGADRDGGRQGQRRRSRW